MEEERESGGGKSAEEWRGVERVEKRIKGEKKKKEERTKRSKKQRTGRETVKKKEGVCVSWLGNKGRKVIQWWGKEAKVKKVAKGGGRYSARLLLITVGSVCVWRMNPTWKKGTRGDVERKFRKQHSIDGEGKGYSKEEEASELKGEGNGTLTRT